MPLVTVATFLSPADAQIAQSTLASRGIETFLADEHVVRMDPLAAIAYGGVKINVGAADAAEARAILEPEGVGGTVTAPRSTASVAARLAALSLLLIWGTGFVGVLGTLPLLLFLGTSGVALMGSAPPEPPPPADDLDGSTTV